MDFLVEPENPPYKLEMKAYTDLYLPHHFIFWSDETDDYTNMFGPKPECDDEYLELVTKHVAALSRQLLTDEEILEDPPIDQIYRPIASNGFDAFGGKKSPEWELELDNPDGDFLENTMIGARSMAPKRPGEVRDIGIQTPQSLRMHRIIMWPLQRACRRIKGCPHGRPNDQLEKIVTTIGENSSRWYMRDYMKSGMTIPHAVIRAVFAGFYERRPDMIEIAAGFWEEQQLFFKEGDTWELKRPTTGSPLGMFVEGYTLLQYAIHQINVDSVDVPSRAYHFSATNDDMVVGSSSIEALEAYQYADIITNNALGMAYKSTKSGISDLGFVYCETYWFNERIVTKDSLFSGAMIGAKYAETVGIAKDFCYAMCLAAGRVTPPMEQALIEVRSEFQPEFCEDEKGWPYLFGGWYPCIRDGLDESHLWYDGNLMAAAAYWACRVKLRSKGKLDDKPHLALGRAYRIRLLREPEQYEDFVDLIPFLGTKKALKRHYRKAQKQPDEVRQEFLKLHRLRRERFESFLNGKADMPDPLVGYLDRHPAAKLQGLPGLRTKKAMDILKEPSNAIRFNSTEHWLGAMRSMGIIDYQGTNRMYVGETIKQIWRWGITSPMSYKYLAVSDQGCSIKLLRGRYKGVTELFDRTGHAFVSYGEDDFIPPCTKLWPYMKRSSLRTLIRAYSTCVKNGWTFADDSQFLQCGMIFDRMNRDMALRRQEELSMPQPDEEEVIPDVRVEKFYPSLEELFCDILREQFPPGFNILEHIRSTMTFLGDSSMLPSSLAKESLEGGDVPGEVLDDNASTDNEQSQHPYDEDSDLEDPFDVLESWQ